MNIGQDNDSDDKELNAGGHNDYADDDIQYGY